MLGIIDWGIGGVSIYKLIKEQTPNSAILYFSDTGATPYGKMSRRELADRLDSVIEFLKSKGMTRLVIGCNAASTAIPDLRDHGIKIGGVIEPAVSAAAKLRPKDLGVIGGRRTIVSGVYRRAFADKGINIKQRIAQPLSGLIESGDVSSDFLNSEVKRILAPLHDCSHILLACTHYPAISAVLKNHVSGSTELIDPATALFNSLEDFGSNETGTDHFFTTGTPMQMQKSSRLAFDVDILRIDKIKL